MNRGLERRSIFREPADFERFLNVIERTTSLFRIEVHAYCLMGNHYHLLLRAPQRNLREAIRRVEEAYTRAFNRVHDRHGPLLRGSFRTRPVRAGRQLVCASRYIHLNPVEAATVARPEDWPYSSYLAYLDPAIAPPWLRTAVVLGSFGSVGARARYRRFVEEGIDPGTRSHLEAAGRTPLPRSWLYRDELQATIDDRSEVDLPRCPEVPSRARPTLEAVARVVCATHRVALDDLRAVSRRRDRTICLARGAFVDLAIRCGGHRMRRACAWLGYRTTASGSAAAERFRTACAGSEEARARARGAIDILLGDVDPE